MSAVAERLSVAEYLERERASDLRHEYVDGEASEMTGGSFRHARIIGNVAYALRTALGGRNEAVLAADMRVHCPDDAYLYPDVVVAAHPPRLQDDLGDTLLNPLVVVEVLSPSTERFDRGRKFEHYRSIPSLREYVLVAQDRPAVERYVRTTESSAWQFVAVAGLDGRLELESLGATVPLTEIYAKVDFPPTA